MIDLNRFNEEQKVIVPIYNNSFTYKNKKYKLNSAYESAWYNVSIQNNNVKIIEPVYIETINISNFSIIKGYSYNNNIIFQNFDVGKRKLNKEIMSSIRFNNAETFSSIICIIWEDQNLYYYSQNYQDSNIFIFKQAYEENKDILNYKNLTPEIRTLFLFSEFEKKKLNELKLKQEIEEKKKTLEGRLLYSCRRVGAELIKYSISGNRIIVDWSINNQQFNSVLNKNNFQVIEAGYCLTNDDTRHNLHSMIVLARDYIKDNLIYKTRS